MTWTAADARRDASDLNEQANADARDEARAAAYDDHGQPRWAGEFCPRCRLDECRCRA
ncbi:hypothetical protein [Nocardioides terrisoli]|uniref:hypothetical protein n=1 Tax=Nocardioides terrisoli TaxID=3388267 RepID=UPI00287B5DF7|nr:hypothetical protein [Nocardioides marmorisolisilvae]